MSGLSNAKKQDNNDLGFGNQIIQDESRLINKDGSFNILRQGLSTWHPYQALVEMSWSRFFVVVLLFYVGVNAFFGLLYVWIGVEYLSGVNPQGLVKDFISAFFFSTQTFTTVGYGAISPSGFAANLVAALGALVGLMAFALATGLFFARFAKPKAKIAFSEKAVIAPYRGIKSLQFRIANQRDNKLINLKASVSLSWVETDDQGNKKRRFSGLNLERDSVYLLPLNWTIVHPIDEHSPLSEKTEQDLLDQDVEVIISIAGFDETFSTTVYTNSSYTCREIIWGAKFKPMFFPKEGMTILDLEKIGAIYSAKLPKKNG